MTNQSLHNYFFENYLISITEKDVEEITRILSDQNIPKDTVMEIFLFYNQNRNRMQEAKEFSDTRKNNIKARIKKFGIEKVKEVIILSSKSEFLNGRNSQTWKANFDWILKPANFIKIYEGNYQNNEQQSTPAKPRRNR